MKLTNPNQSQWLKTASSAEARAFLSKGDPDVGQAINTETGEMSYYPTLRGVKIGEKFYLEAAEAMKIATDMKAAFLAEGLPALDEVALGIDGEALRLFNAAQDDTFRVDSIIHIGLAINDSDAMSPALRDFVCDNLDDSLIDDLASKMPGLASLKKVKNNRDMPDEFADVIHANCLYGYLVEVATPVMVHTLNPDNSIKSSTCSWGSYISHWFYDESLSGAVEQGRQWTEELRKQEVAEQLAELVSAD